MTGETLAILSEVSSASSAADLLAPPWMCDLWFVILCLLLVGYAILDGFDLGVGIIHLIIGRNARERAVHTNVIGPIWDGNEVWLVTFGGALFAAFPLAYGSIFSAFMVPLVMVLFCLIARATSLEFRSKASGPRMILLCDVAFSLASLLATFLLGVAVGAVMEGIPIDEAGNLVLPGIMTSGGAGPFEEITFAMTSFSVSCGILAVTVFALHGAMFLNLKATGITEKRIGQAFPALYYAFATTLLMTTYLAFRDVDSVSFSTPSVILVTILNVIAILNLPRAMYRGRKWSGFIASSFMVAALVFLFGSAVHPNLLISSLDPTWSITVQNAASTRATLLTMLVVVSVGIPFILLYTAITYWTFRGTVSIEGEEGESDS